jgi:restriction endonuclease S subunit
MIELRKFKEIFQEIYRPIEIENNVEYNCAGVRLNGQGVFLRERKIGQDILKKHVQHVIQEGDIVYSTLFSQKGAFAIADSNSNGFILSEKFPTYRLIADDINLSYLKWFFRSNYLPRITENQITGMAAFSLSHLSKKKFLQLSLPVPSSEEQLRIVKKCENASNLCTESQKKLDKNIILFKALPGKVIQSVLQKAPMIPISKLGEYVIRDAKISPDAEYKQVTVSLNNNGLRLRKICTGSEILSPGQCYVMNNDLLFSRIDLRNGAIGFVGKDLEGGVVSRDFPVFLLNDNNEINRIFLDLVFRTDMFKEQASSFSKGTTNRKKIKRDIFLKIEVPWPKQEVREKIVCAMSILLSETNNSINRLQKDNVLFKEYSQVLINQQFVFNGEI